jgi:membrane protein implicated in regulation of membrane protease activity
VFLVRLLRHVLRVTRDADKMKTYVKYFLFQISQWLVLGAFLWIVTKATAVPAWIIGVFFVCWIIKDIVVYPWVRRAYTDDAKTGTEKLIGASGLTQDRLDPEGFIKVNGELWQARGHRANEVIEPGTVVKISKADGMVLIVQR